MRSCIFVLNTLFFVSQILAQSVHEQKGRVVSGLDGSPLAGATLYTPKGLFRATSDQQGYFRLALPEEKGKLRVKYQGYVSVELMLDPSSDLLIKMYPKDSPIQAANSDKIHSWFFPASSVSEALFNEGNLHHPLQLVQGKQAALSISLPGNTPFSAPQFRVRGLSTISGTDRPLAVIDGIPGLPIESLDPWDLQSLAIVQETAAAADWGIRGSGGVLRLSTFDPQDNREGIIYQGQYSWESPTRMLEVLDANTYRNLSNTVDLGAESDWLKEVTRNGSAMAHRLVMSGGQNTFKYKASLTFRDMDWVGSQSGFTRVSGRAHIEQSLIQDRVKIRLQMASLTQNSEPIQNEAFRYAATFNPTAVARSTDPAYIPYGGYYQQLKFEYYNPLALVAQSVERKEDKYELVGIQAEGNISQNLSAYAHYARHSNNSNYSAYYSKQGLWKGIERNGFAQRQIDRETGNFARLGVRYLGKVLAGHNLLADLGYSRQDFLREGLDLEGGNFLTDAFLYNNLGASADFDKGLGQIASYKNAQLLSAYYAQIHLSDSQWYNLSVSFRTEGASILEANNKWEVFPAAQLDFNLSRLLGYNNPFTLHLSWGQSGGLPVAGYLSRGILGQTGVTYYNGSYIPQYSQVQLENPNLGAELRREFNIGLYVKHKRWDADLLFYSGVSDKLLLEHTLEQGYGIGNTASLWLNSGKLSNSGIEARVGYTLIQTPAWNWKASFNGAYFIQQRIENLYSASIDKLNEEPLRYASLGAPGACCSQLGSASSGKDLGQLVGPTYDGIDENGQWVLKSTNTEGIENIDFGVIGNGLPKFVWGVYQQIQHKQWELHVLLRGAGGHDLVNVHKVLFSTPALARNYNIVVDEALRDLQEPGLFSSYYVEKSNFVRLENLALHRRIQFGSSDNGLRDMVLYASVNNLFTLSDYSGGDPDIRYTDNSSFRYSNLASGIDRNTFFSTRSWNLGIRLEL